MQEVYDFLKKTETYYLATVEGNQPRVRPFGTIDLFEGKLYIQTGKSKDVAKQIFANPKIELSAFDAVSGVWIRVQENAVEDPRRDVKVHMLDAYPVLKEGYSPDDDNTLVLALNDGVATITSFADPPKVIKF
jgi:uncharacterized pyridoxamine 5'-phosphate oxidase family protein